MVITGSRKWADVDAIEKALEGADFAILGDCPTGADAIALDVCKRLGIERKVFRADWDLPGDKGGPLRNVAMAAAARRGVTAGWVVVAFAFPIGEKWSGTRHCMGQLAQRGIPVTTPKTTLRLVRSS